MKVHRNSLLSLFGAMLLLAASSAHAQFTPGHPANPTNLLFWSAVLNDSKEPVEEIRGVPVVVDGNTIAIADRTVRLFGVDAPDKQQQCLDADGEPYACGQRALGALVVRINNQRIECAGNERDALRRLRVVCRIGTVDLNAWLVNRGHAIADRMDSQAYVPYEREARNERRGLWAGRFVAPSRWRAGDRLDPDPGQEENKPSIQ